MNIAIELPDQIVQGYLDEVEENLEIELAEFYTEGWTINNKETASKVDYVIHKLEEKIEEDESIAANQKATLQAKIDKLEEGKAKLDEWLARSTNPHKRRIEDLKVHLHLYHQRVIEAEERENEKRIAEGKKPLKISKSIKLAYRDLISKQQFPEIVKDDMALVEWVSENHSSTLKLSELRKFIKAKQAAEESEITVNELLGLINDLDSDFISRELKLSWAEFKKTLTEREVPIYESIEGEDIVVGKRLAYFDSYGQEVPHVQLIERGIKFDWKLNK